MKILILLELLLLVSSKEKYEDIMRNKKIKHLRPWRFKTDPWDLYGMYTFAVNWGSTLCLSKGEECYEKLKVVPKYEISIHGLWPSMINGDGLEDCNQGSQIEVIDDGSETFLQMRKYWPTLVTDNKYFWEHEYNKHGYCMSKKLGYDVEKPELYFKKALEVYFNLHINTIIIDIFGSDHSGEVYFTAKEFLEKIKEKVGGDYFTATCKSISGKRYLNELRFKLDMNFNLFDNKKGGGTCGKREKDKVYLDFWSPN